MKRVHNKKDPIKVFCTEHDSSNVRMAGERAVGTEEAVLYLLSQSNVGDSSKSFGGLYFVLV